MNCPNCGFLLPDDSKFCQYCGTVLSGTAPGGEPAHAPAGPQAVLPDAAASPAAVPAPAAASDARNPGGTAPRTHRGKKTRQCKACGADIDPRTKKCTACGKPASRVQPAALALAAVSVLLVCSLAGNLIQYSSAAQMQQELERKLEQQLESSNAAITAQKADILKLENQLKETEEASQRSQALLLYTKSELEQAQKEAYNYDLIRSFLTKSDAGYASDQFFASKSVLILSRTGEDRTFSLTTGFSGGECSFSTSGNSARVSFTENAWSGSTTIRVSPKSAGTTYVTFSNTVNSQTFRVLILVTD